MTSSTEFDRRNFLSLAGRVSAGHPLLRHRRVTLERDSGGDQERRAHLSHSRRPWMKTAGLLFRIPFSVTRGIISEQRRVSPSPRIVTEALVRYLRGRCYCLHNMAVARAAVRDHPDQSG